MVGAIAIALPMLLGHGITVAQVDAGDIFFESPELFTLVQTATSQFYDRDYDNAERNFQAALVELQARYADSELRAQVLHDLARIYLLQSRYTEAQSLLAGLAQGPWVNASILNNLALANFYTGRYAAAESVLSRVIAEWEAIRAGDDLTDRDRVTLFEQQAHSYRLMQRVLVAQGKPEAALVMAEQGRGRALVEYLVRAEGGDLAVAPPTLAEMRAIARRQNTTLVIYSVLGDGRRILGNEVEVETDLYIWVIAPEGTLTFRQTPLLPLWQQWGTALGTRSGAATATDLSPLETLVQTTRSALGLDARGVGVVPTTRRVTDDLPPSNPLPMRSLYDMLVAPISDVLPTDPDQVVTLIPQGPLFLVPFAALQDSSGQVFIDRHTIALSPSVQVLALTGDRDSPPADATGLVVGNPLEMPSVSPFPNQEPVQLPPLPGAEQEAIAIAALLNTQPLTRQQATKAAVLRELPRSHIIHLATHGLLNLDSRLNEFGLPTDPNAPTAADARVYVTPGAVIVGDNVTVGGTDASVALARERVVRITPPGVLALAPTPGDDGWLTAAEIARLHLPADLVVLSACDTGRGRITGDGVVGLPRAFLAAGANTVVVSLWQVPDQPTAVLMVSFYEHLAQTGDKARSLRAAMLDTRAEFPDPRNWSAFVLIGDPR